MVQVCFEDFGIFVRICQTSDVSKMTNKCHQQNDKQVTSAKCQTSDVSKMSNKCRKQNVKQVMSAKCQTSDVSKMT